MTSQEKKQRVLGYIKPESSFYTLDEWEDFVLAMLKFQVAGYDTRGGQISGKKSTGCDIDTLRRLQKLVNKV